MSRLLFSGQQPLNVPGEFSTEGIVSSGDIVKWYNGHPKAPNLSQLFEEVPGDVYASSKMFANTVHTAEQCGGDTTSVAIIGCVLALTYTTTADDAIIKCVEFERRKRFPIL